MDGETYLRMQVEGVVHEVGRRPPVDMRDAGSRLSALARVSEALVAAGALDADVAGAIRSDLDLAIGLRTAHWANGLEPHQWGPRFRPHGPVAGAPLPPLRRAVRGCQAELEVNDGTLQLRYLVADDSGTELVATARERTGPGRPGGARGGWAPATAAAPASPSVVNISRRLATGSSPRTPSASGGHQMARFDDFTMADDGGASIQVATSSASGGDDRWQLRFRLEPAPRASATALVVSSERGGTVRAPLQAPVAARIGPVEPTSPQWNPAEWFLLASAERSFRWWRRAHAHGGVPTPPVDDPAVAALVAVGALDSDSPVIAMTRALARAGSGEAAPSGLPESWAGVLAHVDDDDGHDATVALGVALPRLGDREVWVDALTSESDGWRLHLFLRPGVWPGPGAGLSGHDLRVAAGDDLGGSYVGFLDGGGGGAAGISMGMAFVPRLDPRAAEVRLEISVGGRRAGVVAPLPAPWGAGR